MKRILISIAVIFLVIQFFRIDTTNPVIISENDFIEITNPPESVAAILKTSCYDCHSSQTQYPWYSQIAPVSWWLADHIKEGRGELNFSEWGTFSDKRKAKKLHEIIEEVEEGEMPLNSYLITHSSAKLTVNQSEELITWVKYLENTK